MSKHPCPVCGKFQFPDEFSFEVCPVCGWEDDAIQEENPDEEACANALSLNEHRRRYREGWLPKWILNVGEETERLEEDGTEPKTQPGLEETGGRECSRRGPDRTDGRREGTLVAMVRPESDEIVWYRLQSRSA